MPPGDDHAGAEQLSGHAVQRTVPAGPPAAELVRMEAVVPVLFYGKPGDLVRIQRSDWDRNGSWRVVEASVQADEAGGRTRLELAVPDVVI